jgi:hypothetical protein
LRLAEAPAVKEVLVEGVANLLFQILKSLYVCTNELEPDSNLLTELTNENNFCYRHHQSLLPTKSIREYDVVIPMTPHGLLLNVAEVKDKELLPWSRFQHNEKRPRQTGCPNSNTIRPNSYMIYLTIETCS